MLITTKTTQFILNLLKSNTSKLFKLIPVSGSRSVVSSNYKYVQWNEVASLPHCCAPFCNINVLSLTLKTVDGQQGYKFYRRPYIAVTILGRRDVIGQVTIRFAVAGFSRQYGRAYATVLHLSVCLSEVCTECIVAKRCVLRAKVTIDSL